MQMDRTGMVQGRRARRERRLAKERRIKEREFCPPR